MSVDMEEGWVGREGGGDGELRGSKGVREAGRIAEAAFKREGGRAGIG
jgi:hypothetical protein